MRERVQSLVAELREVEKLRTKLRHVEARTIGRDGVSNGQQSKRGTNSATRQALYSGQAIASIFLGRCTSKDRDEPIPFPKLNVVLAMHLLGSTSRSLLIDAVELRGADHSSVAVHHEHSVPHDGSAIQGGPPS